MGRAIDVDSRLDKLEARIDKLQEILDMIKESATTKKNIDIVDETKGKKNAKKKTDK